MADKEERIWLEFYIPKPKGAIEATRCTTMTRQEAVDRMAKEIFKAEICEGSGFNVKPSDFDPKDWNKKWDNLSIDKKRIYYAAAEAALNSLLENKK